MKKSTILVLLVLLTTQITNAMQIAEIQTLPDGTQIKMCNFENGGYGYCTIDDKNNAIRASYNATLQKQPVTQTINTVRGYVDAGVSTLDSAFDGVRVITSFFGRGW